jgi:hypothetical protein
MKRIYGSAYGGFQKIIFYTYTSLTCSIGLAFNFLVQKTFTAAAAVPYSSSCAVKSFKICGWMCTDSFLSIHRCFNLFVSGTL